MDLVARFVGLGARLVLAPFDQLPRTLGLTAFAAFCGLLMLAVVAWTTPQRRLAVARDRMSSAVYEVRLFLDSPWRVLVAQMRLLGWSVVYLVYLLPAVLVLAPVLALFYGPLEARFGLRPLSAGETALVRVALDRGRATAAAELVTTEVPAGVRLDAPPVLEESAGVLFLRFVVATPGQHEVRLAGPGWGVVKLLSVGPSRIVHGDRRAGLGGLLAVGGERLLPGAGPVRSVSVAHAPATGTWLGLPLPWWGYWLLVSTLVALALRKRFRVAL